ncbi:hypothetical protein DMZ48_18540 [Robertkochia solimangrovi]|nr:hypothetical protein DMZ48_18540 [Robertkochia solimangrovi]
MSYVKKNIPEKAIPYLKEVLNLSRERHDVKLEKEGHRHLAKAYEQLGDFEQAHREQEYYADLMKELLKEESRAALLDKEHDAAVDKKQIEAALDHLSLLDDRKSKILAGGSISILILGGMLFFFIRKKKNLEADREKFQESYALLNDQNKALKTRLTELAAKKSTDTTKSAPYKNSSLTEEDRKKYMQMILDHLEKEKPYLQFEFNQSELALTLAISKQHLSEVLRLCFDQNFYQLVNLYRVNEAQRIMQEPEYHDYKILAIAYEAGFSSKTSFNRVFKGHTGLTPSEYRKKLFPHTTTA